MRRVLAGFGVGLGLIISTVLVTRADEWKPLRIAVTRGNLERVKELLEAEGGVNKTKRDRLSNLLRTAAIHGHKEIAALLIETGAVVNSKGKFGRTALHHAVEHGRVDVVKLLLEHKAKAHMKLRKKQTIAHLAAMGGSREVMEILLSKGASPSKADATKMTPLHYAAQKGCTEIIELLVTYKSVDVNAKTESKWTPLDFAVGNDQKQAAEVLKKHGGKANRDWR